MRFQRSNQTVTILSLYLLQALTILRKDKNNVVNIEEAIDFVNNQLSVDQTEESSVQQTQASQDQRLPFTQNPPSSAHAEDSHLNPLDQNDLQIPSELVSRCMATLLMIQVKFLKTHPVIFFLLRTICTFTQSTFLARFKQFL